MFLHVNVGPRWTLGRRCFSAHRAYLTGFSKRCSFILLSTSSFSPRRLQHPPSVSYQPDPRSAQDARAPSTIRSSKASRSSAASHDRVAQFTTSASRLTTSPTSLDVADAGDRRPVPNESLEQLELLTILEDNILQDVPRINEGSHEIPNWALPFHSSSGLETGHVSLPTSECHDDASVSKEYSTYEVVRTDPVVFSETHSRQLPTLFSTELIRLGKFMAEKRGTKDILDAFSDAIREGESLWQLHGLNINSWLRGPWDSAKAVRVTKLLLGSIVTSPDQVVEILTCLDEVDDDFVFRCRCLSFTGYMHKDELSRKRGLMAKFDSELKKLASPHLWPSTEMRRRHLSLLLWRMTSEEAPKLIKAFLYKYPAASLNTRLYLAMYCARNRLEPLALSILTELPPEELNSPSPLTLRCCQVLLGHDEVEVTPDGPNFKFLPRLLEKGLAPDNILYSRIMESALESGYPDVAWDIFHYLQARKIEMTGWTYLLMLRHAFNENNVARVQELMSEIQNTESLSTDAHLLTYSMNIVRRIFHHEKDMTTAESLSHLLALYDRAFSRDALVKLGIVPSMASSGSEVARVESETDSEDVEPDAYCLSFTIWAFVLCNRSSRSVWKLWARIQELIEAGDAQIAECMRLDLIYNAFIWLNLKDKRAQNMTTALQILQYMLTKQLCVPTDRTWSILICGFLRHDQNDQARSIYGLMEQYNLTVKDIRKEYWRANWTFEYLEEHTEQILDENMMPDGTEMGVAEVVRSRSGEVGQQEVMEEHKLELRHGM